MMKHIVKTWVLSLTAFYAADVYANQANVPNSPQELLTCYHVVDGVRRPSPYTAVPVGTQCPPCGQNANCRADDVVVERQKSLQGLPPHLCEEEALPDWL